MTMRDQFEVYQCFFDVMTPSGTHRTDMQAPRFMIEQQFLSYVEQARIVDKPVKIKLCRYVLDFDRHDQRTVSREYAIEYANNAYINEYGEAI